MSCSLCVFALERDGGVKIEGGGRGKLCRGKRLRKKKDGSDKKRQTAKETMRLGKKKE